MSVDDKERPRILIVDDEPMIAISVEELLVDAGFAIAGVAGKLGKALAIIEGAECDAAILDANLASVSASPIALALAARGLPFVVLSGYSSDQLPSAFHGALFIKKPCRPDRIIDALKSILSQR